jgi:hypothetical protein
MDMLISVVILLIVCGALLYVLRLLPIDATFKSIAQVVIIVAVVIYLLYHLTGYIHA